jgi:predicted Zn-dependent peptidase
VTRLDRQESPVLRQAIHAGRHASGLEVFVIPTPGLTRTYGLFATRYGSIASTFLDPASGESVTVPDGIAHFLEHRLFEQPDETDVTDRFAQLGASTNAYTWYTQTAYLFSTIDHPRECLDTLLDFVQEPHFRAERVENEKGIIAEEIKMYDDDPYHRGFRAMMAALYQTHPVRIDIAGTVETIADITPADLDRCWRTFYHPANMMLVVAGALTPEQVAEAVDTDLATRSYAPGARVVAMERRISSGPPWVRGRSLTPSNSRGRAIE